VRLCDLLSRVDEELLQKIVGKVSVKLLCSMDSRQATPSRLRAAVVGLRSYPGLLRSPEIRTQLFNYLRSDEARRLANILGVEDIGDAFFALRSCSITKNSAREARLFQFFEVPVPPKEPDLPPACQIVDGSYNLFTHQRHAALQITNMLSRPPRRALLHMPTGSGKTRTAMHIIARHLLDNIRGVVVWCAYSEELCSQATNEFIQAWSVLGDRSVGVYRFWGGYDLDPSSIKDGLIVIGLSKAYCKAKTDISFISALGSRASLVVIDEAHQAIAETYKLVLDALVVIRNDSKLLGLTATPGRSWNDISSDEELADFFARKKVSLDIPGYKSPVDYLVENEYLAKAQFSSLFHKAGIKLNQADLTYIHEKLAIPKHILSHLAADEKRNMRIVLKAEELLTRHARVILFAASVEHADILATVLRARGSVAYSVTSNTGADDRAQIINDYRSNSSEHRIICNFGVLTTGFDAPQTSAALIARPTASLVLYSQMVGRAIRGVRAGGNKTAEIVTVVDQELPGFGTVAEAFSNWEDVWRRNYET